MYSVKQLGTEPIILLTVTNPFNPLEEFGPMLKAVSELAKNIPGPVVWRLVDSSALDLTFDDLTNAMYMDTRSGDGSARDPRLKSVWVGSSELIRLAVDSLKKPIYGNVDAKLFSSIEDARAYIQQEILAASTTTTGRSKATS